MKSTTIKRALAATAFFGSLAAVAAMNQPAAQTDQRRTFYFDETVVEKIVPNNELGTMTVYLKNGKTKTYPFTWDRIEEFEAKARTEFVVPNKALMEQEREAKLSK